MLHHIPISALIEQYGYLITFVGTFLEGETILVFSAIAAHLGLLWLPAVIGVATLGATLGDLVFFFIGRRYGTAFIARFPSIQKSTVRVSRLVERFPNASIIIFRFIYGLKVSGAVLIGMSRISTERFILLNFIGSFIWASSITTLSYLFASSLSLFMGRIHHVEKTVLVVLVAVAATYYVSTLIRKKVSEVEAVRNTQKESV